MLDLSECEGLEALPEEIGELERLKILNVSHCVQLSVVPESITRLSSLLVFRTYGFKGLSYRPLDQPQQAVTVKLLRFYEIMKRKVALEELATRQESMVSTLERMAWPVILLATATFIAFLSPPGGYDEDSHMVRSGNLRQWFFILDGLSFGLSISCLMMIVVISMPHLTTGNKDYEAGRFWLLLVVTWGLLWLAVVTGFVAFLLSGLATVSHRITVLGPLVPGISMLVVGLIMIFSKLVLRLNPGPRAICTAINRECCCGLFNPSNLWEDKESVMDDDILDVEAGI